MRVKVYGEKERTIDIEVIGIDTNIPHIYLNGNRITVGDNVVRFLINGCPSIYIVVDNFIMHGGDSAAYRASMIAYENDSKSILDLIELSNGNLKKSTIDAAIGAMSGDVIS